MKLTATDYDTLQQEEGTALDGLREFSVHAARMSSPAKQTCRQTCRTSTGACKPQSLDERSSNRLTCTQKRSTPAVSSGVKRSSTPRRAGIRRTNCEQAASQRSSCWCRVHNDDLLVLLKLRTRRHTSLGKRLLSPARPYTQGILARPLDQARSIHPPTGAHIAADRVTTDRSCFLPFSTVPQSGAGKNLAMLEMRAVVCALAQLVEVEVEVAKGFSLHSQEQNIRDICITLRGPLLVNMVMRVQ